MSAYLFVHFINTEDESLLQEQVYFSVSEDGRKWTTLNDKQPILISDVGTGGVRDPFIIRAESLGKFFIVGTDLLIQEAESWEEIQCRGSQSIVSWESNDLIEWSSPRLVKVAHETAGCVWAPEVIYDKKNENYVIFWASRLDFGNDLHKIYYCLTKDFQTFSNPNLFLEREMPVIDTTIVEEGGIFYRFSKDESLNKIIFEKAEELFGEYYEIQTNLAEISGVEGPAVFKLESEGTWCLLLDAYIEKGKYIPFYSKDLNGEFVLQYDDFKMDVKAKHGSVIPITDTEYKALIKAYCKKGENIV
jgi:hypothetical protein